METHQCFDTRLGRQMGTAQSILTRFGPKHRDLHVGNWNVSSLNEKETGTVWEADQYHLRIVGLSSTKCWGSYTVEFNEG